MFFTIEASNINFFIELIPKANIFFPKLIFEVVFRVDYYLSRFRPKTGFSVPQCFDKVRDKPFFSKIENGVLNLFKDLHFDSCPWNDYRCVNCDIFVS